MKSLKFVLFAVIVSVLQSVQAQYITPGNQQSYTLDALVTLSGGVVSFADGTYQVNGALTISATDTLRISSAAVVRIASGIRPEFLGTLISDPVEGHVVFTAIDTTTASTNFKGLRFDNSQSNLLRNTIITYGGGVQLISAEATFEDCIFRKNGSSNVSAVITYSNCSPIISGCVFSENARSAIGSGANVMGSPKILNNIIYQNTTDNSNRPQINLGPGGADTVYIVGNYVEGFYTNAGGIGISNLLATGSTTAVVRDNYIINNRYGFAQIGANISTVIENNSLIDNDIQNQPNLGGSGLNFQASGTGNVAIVRNNLITGNLWGVTIQNVAQPNFGTADDPGGNIFYENGNGGVSYALYNNTVNDITAIGNYWGTNDPVEAEAMIFHQPDQAGLGLVTYLPILTIEPVIEQFVFLSEDNAGLTTDVIGQINQQDLSINLVVPFGTDLTSLIPQITLPEAVTSNPQGGIPTDFTNPVTYAVDTPHGQSAVYIVTVEVEAATYSVVFDVKDTNGQNINDAVLQFAGIDFPQGVYTVTNLLSGTYPYEISHPLYNTFFGEATVVDQNLTVNVTLTLLAYDVTFNVMDEQGNPINDATVTLGGNSLNSSPYIFEDVLPGLYIYLVEKEGFVSFTGNIEVTNMPVSVDVTLELFVLDVNFLVKNIFETPVEEALVFVNGVGQQLTDASGMCSFIGLTPGVYTYVVSKALHSTETGTFTLTDTNLTVEIFLDVIPGVNENALEEIQFFPNPVADKIQFNGSIGKFDLQITDLNGKILIHQKAVNADQEIDVSHLKSGFYIAALTYNGAQKTIKFQKN